MAGEAAVDDDGYYVDNCLKVVKTREKTVSELLALGFECTASKANFIFAKSKNIGGEELYLKLKERGVLVRHFTDPKICEYNRITVGSPEEMDILIKEIKAISEEKNYEKR